MANLFSSTCELQKIYDQNCARQSGTVLLFTAKSPAHSAQLSNSTTSASSVPSRLAKQILQVYSIKWRQHEVIKQYNNTASNKRKYDKKYLQNHSTTEVYGLGTKSRTLLLKELTATIKEWFRFFSSTTAV
jgi:hypothetical protein